MVAAHFVPDAAHVAYVRGPVGLGDEGEAITGPNAKPIAWDLHHLTRWGYNPQLWEAWQEDMLNYYRQAFSYSPWVLYTINKQDVNGQCGTSVELSIPTFEAEAVPCTGQPVEVDVAEWAVDHGFGLAQNSLDGSWIWRDPAKNDPPAGDVNTIFAFALQHTPRPFIELQTAQAQSTWCNFAVVKGLPHCVANKNAFVDAEDDVSYARTHGVTVIEWYQQDLTSPELQPVIDLWRQLQTIPGTGKIPTAVTVTPAQPSVQAGANLSVTISVGAPGITGFAPGGTVSLFDCSPYCATLKTVQLAPDKGTIIVHLKGLDVKPGHINLRASYADFATYLWQSSTSADARVTVRPAS
jgi:hypothetical protein